MSFDPAGLNLRGAVPLDARPTTAPAASAPPVDGAVTVLDVTEASFQADVIERSQQVPVVLDFWAEWCGPCKQLSPVLERLAAEGGGAWVLAKIDVDANPRLAEAAQVQGIPAVKVVIGGQIAGEFTGAIPEAQAREWIAEVLAIAQQAGLPGLAPGGDPDAEPPLPPVDPMIAQAEDALEAGDFDGARVAFQARLDVAPADGEASSGLARVNLFARVDGVDLAQARATAEAAPDDVEAQMVLADLELVEGEVQIALDRLVGLVRRTSGEERDAVRVRLLELFEVLDPADEIVSKARRALSTALF